MRSSVRWIRMVEIKTLNVRFTEETFEELEAVKGDRSWPEAIKEEFGI